MKSSHSSFRVFSVILGFVAGIGVSNGARADRTYAYVIAANDGYGLSDCLGGGGLACGQIVADAWCEAHGHGAAISFGRESRFDLALVKVSTDAEPYVVNCRE
ncbi:MAG: hypothetical protein ACLPN5_17500 [Roseiarcus sp.]